MVGISIYTLCLWDVSSEVRQLIVINWLVFHWSVLVL